MPPAKPREWPQEQLDTMLEAVRRYPGREASWLAQLIPFAQGRGVSRDRALGMLSTLEDQHLVTRTTAQRQVTWDPVQDSEPAEPISG